FEAGAHHPESTTAGPSVLSARLSERRRTLSHSRAGGLALAEHHGTAPFPQCSAGSAGHDRVSGRRPSGAVARAAERNCPHAGGGPGAAAPGERRAQSRGAAAEGQETEAFAAAAPARSGAGACAPSRAGTARGRAPATPRAGGGANLGGAFERDGGARRASPQRAQTGLFAPRRVGAP